MNLLIRWVVAAISLFAADWLIEGISVSASGSDRWLVYGGMAVVLWIVSLLVKPILTLLTCPIQILTLGLFSLVINAIAFWLASLVAQELDIGFFVDGFVAAFLGALVVSIISTLLNQALIDEG